MPVSLPYLPSNKNIGELFSAIQSAIVPPRFTHDFLSKTLGLKSTNDRAMIPLLRSLGFIDQSGAPTADYRLLKSNDTSKGVIASATRKAYSPLFNANEAAHTLASEKLKGLVSQVAGTDSVMTARIASTFNALVKLADFSSGKQPTEATAEEGGAEKEEAEGGSRNAKRGAGNLAPDFHYNIQVHLPANGTEDTYLNIFNALRKVFQ